MSSGQSPLFIKIKYAGSTRKVRVPNQPAPVWSKLSKAIIDRFVIPENQSIGLQYVDSDGDAITISSQVEFDELWHEITLAARPSQKNGTDQRALSLELVLIDPINPFQPKQPSDHNKDQNVMNAESTPATGSTPKPDSTPIGGSTTQIIDPSGEFSPLGHATTESCNPIKSDSAPCTSAADPPEYPIAASPSPNIQNTPVDLSLGLSALLTALDGITPKLQSTLGSYARMVVQVTDQLSDTCRVIANQLQEPPTQTGPTNPLSPQAESRSPAAQPTHTSAPCPSSHPATNPVSSKPVGPAGCSGPRYPVGSGPPWTTMPSANPPLPASDYEYDPMMGRYTLIDKNFFGNDGLGGLPTERDTIPPMFPHQGTSVHDKTFLFGAPALNDFSPEPVLNYSSLPSGSAYIPTKSSFANDGLGSQPKQWGTPTSIFSQPLPSLPYRSSFFSATAMDDHSREPVPNSFRPSYKATSSPTDFSRNNGKWATRGDGSTPLTFSSKRSTLPAKSHLASTGRGNPSGTGRRTTAPSSTAADTSAILADNRDSSLERTLDELQKAGDELRRKFQVAPADFTEKCQGGIPRKRTVRPSSLTRSPIPYDRVDEEENNKGKSTDLAEDVTSSKFEPHIARNAVRTTLQNTRAKVDQSTSTTSPWTYDGRAAAAKKIRPVTWDEIPYAPPPIIASQMPSGRMDARKTYGSIDVAFPDSDSEEDVDVPSQIPSGSGWSSTWNFSP
ncbi:hypothetical protein Pst134EB_008113 [Puccinia striiformis f. sp. tritici]|nr:hypothetical protein Pst134EB_008113 [Puccinia striiformis f. sp. tritici]